MKSSWELVSDVSSAFLSGAAEELRARWQEWKTSSAEPQVKEVVGGLLARQVTLATSLTGSPRICNAHVAPIVLRAMCDVCITLAWILKAPSERAGTFIKYGLGQTKLEIEHRKAALARGDAESAPLETAMIEGWEAWLNAQTQPFLTEVNVGSWSGLSTREMAKECGWGDFYNYVYQPFSAAVHSTWSHVERLNLIPCSNPLHGFHRVPETPDFGLDLHYFYLAGKYLHRTFSILDDATGVKVSVPSAFEALQEGLRAIDAAFARESENPDQEESGAG